MVGVIIKVVSQVFRLGSLLIDRCFYSFSILFLYCGCQTDKIESKDTATSVLSENPEAIVNALIECSEAQEHVGDIAWPLQSEVCQANVGLMVQGNLDITQARPPHNMMTAGRSMELLGGSDGQEPGGLAGRRPSARSPPVHVAPQYT